MERCSRTDRLCEGKKDRKSKREGERQQTQQRKVAQMFCQYLPDSCGSIGSSRAEEREGQRNCVKVSDIQRQLKANTKNKK